MDQGDFAKYFALEVSFLRDMGYVGPVVGREYSKIYDFEYEVKFSSEKLRRYINFSFYFNHPDVSCRIYVIVGNMDNGDKFYVPDFLKLHNIIFDEHLFDFCIDSDLIVNNSHKILEIKRIFYEVLFQIVSGEIWVHVDFDYGSQL